MTKRNQVLKEIYNSEKLYLHDLKLWGVSFKQLIIGSVNLMPEKKIQLSETLFNNLSEIISLHEVIFRDMQLINLKIAKLNNIKIEKTVIENSQFPFDLKNTAIDLSAFEYFSPFINNLNKISVYKEYSMKMPGAFHEFDKTMSTNKKFAAEVDQFFEKNKINQLGANHFITRPTNKLVRYVLFFKTITKYEENKKFLSTYNMLSAKLKNYVSIFDSINSVYSKNFEIFLLFEKIKFNNPETDCYPINLMYREKNILFSDRLIVKLSEGEPASYKQVLVFKEFILICNDYTKNDSVIKIITAPLYFQRIFLKRRCFKYFKKKENLDAYFTVYIIDDLTTNIYCFYFSNVLTRDNYYKKLLNILEHNRNATTNNNFNFTLRDVVTSSSIDEQVLSICQISSNKKIVFKPEEEPEHVKKFDVNNEISTESSNSWSDLVNYVKNDKITENCIFHDKRLQLMERTQADCSIENDYTDNDSLDENLPDIFDNFKLFGCFSYGYKRGTSTASTFSKMFFQVPESSREIKKLLMFSTSMGTFVKKTGKISKISDLSPKKILYDKNHQLLFLLIDNNVSVAHYDLLTKRLKDVKNLMVATNDIFIGPINDIKYMASIYKANNNYSFINLFRIFQNNQTNVVEIIFYRKLYVSKKISSVIFYNDKIVIANEEFTVVDINSLKTIKLVESFDFVNNLFMKLLPNLNAVSIFYIKKDVFLVCNNIIAFFIDSCGRIIFPHITFNFMAKMKYFKVYRTVLICLSDRLISIFKLSTGKLIFTQKMSGMHFPKQSSRLLIYNEKGIYEIKITEDGKNISFDYSDISNSKTLKSNNIVELPIEIYLGRQLNEFNMINDIYSEMNAAENSSHYTDSDHSVEASIESLDSTTFSSKPAAINILEFDEEFFNQLVKDYS